MEEQIIICELNDERIEMAERKGTGHPDTICDELVEAISIELSKYYLKNFNTIHHYNIDKALLVGGSAEAAFLGGKIVDPIRIIIAGRATRVVNGQEVPINEIAYETIEKWFHQNLSSVDFKEDVVIDIQIRQGSSDLTELFTRDDANNSPLSNDTSFGAGYFPLSILQKRLIQIDSILNSPETRSKFPCIGEDIKIMGVNNEGKQSFTIAIAMIGRHLRDLNDYIDQKEAIKEFIIQKAGLSNCEVGINTADNYERSSVYLTVNGTSAEGGDDGQVGRGNRANGLITPYYPMTLEATAGKNPVSHVGKIYSHFAQKLSEKIVKANLATRAQVFLVSQIGRPVNDPKLIQLRLDNQKVNDKLIREFVQKELSELGTFWKTMIR